MKDGGLVSIHQKLPVSIEPWSRRSQKRPMVKFIQTNNISRTKLLIFFMPGLCRGTICFAALPEKSEGYIQVFLDGGLNQQRMGVCVGL